MDSSSPSTSQSTANQSLQDLEEITLSLIIKNFNPTLLSYDFLSMSGIVPDSWELARQPVLDPRGSQVGFTNGINIVAQGNTLNFIQAINNKNLDQFEFANIAQKYVQKMANAEYQGLSISPKIIVPFSQDDGGTEFIHNTFFNNGSWRSYGKTSVQASLNLSYELEQCRLGVNINPAKLQQPNNVSISAVLFAGNFYYNFMETSAEERLNSLLNYINNWQKDLGIFRDLIYQKFLQKAKSEQESLFT